jgi:seryl-tRNA synthetase
MTTSPATSQTITILDKLHADFTDGAEAVHLCKLKQTLMSERASLSEKIDTLTEEIDDLKAELHSREAQWEAADNEMRALRKKIFDNLPAGVMPVPIISAEQVHAGAWFMHPNAGPVKVIDVSIEDCPGGYYLIARTTHGCMYRFKVYRGSFAGCATDNVQTYAAHGEKI